MSIKGRSVWLSVVLFPLLAWLALPGRFSFWPLLFFCVIPLFYWASAALTGKHAFFGGLFAGLLFYVLQLYWIISVLRTFGGLPWPLATLSLLLLSFYMSLYLALFTLSMYVLTRRGGTIILLCGVPSIWVGLDWLRSWLFGGFPWMDLGYGLWSVPIMIQAADLFGHHILTFIILLVNLVIYIGFSGRFNRNQVWGAAGFVGLVVMCTFFYSYQRWSDVGQSLKNSAVGSIGIVQGNRAQGTKWSPEQLAATVDRYLGLSSRLLEEKSPALIVWPETALPFYPRGNELLKPVTSFVQNNRVFLLSGAPWYEVIDWEKRQFDYYNGAFLFPPAGELSAYFKSHLVPYGEYVPLKKYMPFLAPLVEAAGDFTPGTVETPLVAGDIRAGVLICYESIFPDIGRDWVSRGANIIINLTNDAWYGNSSAPYQSWAMTVLRSVETRRSLVRSANTGISGVIDPLGRVIRESPLFVEWARTIDVPLMDQRTPFTMGGYLFAPVCAVFGLVICIVSSLIARQDSKK